MTSIDLYEIRGLANPNYGGHYVTSRYADLFWLPRIGPAGLALLRWISHQPSNEISTDLSSVAAAIGLGGGERSTRSIDKAIDRLVDHNLALRAPGRIELSLTVPNLPTRRVLALPPSQRRIHDQLVNERQTSIPATAPNAKNGPYGSVENRPVSR